MKCIVIGIVLIAYISWIVWELMHPIDIDEHGEAVEWRNRKKPD